MDDVILITELNDFIFCPVSIYFHKLYGNMDRILYQNTDQINGTAAHKAVDESTYSSSKSIITALDVYCEKYNLIGKIDIYDSSKRLLRERKKMIKQVFPGYIYQLYGQYFALREMGYSVEKMELYSIDDHKHYPVDLPEKDEFMFRKFEQVINEIKKFDMNNYVQENELKCKHCIYEPSCSSSLL